MSPCTRPFVNVGNSCYLNATLQALFAVPSVQRILEDQYNLCDSDEHLSYDMLLALTYADAKLDPVDPEAESMMPEYIVDPFHDGEQHDAEEFFTQLLDQGRGRCPETARLVEHEEKARYQCSMCREPGGVSPQELTYVWSLALPTRDETVYNTI